MDLLNCGFVITGEKLTSSAGPVCSGRLTVILPILKIDGQKFGGFYVRVQILERYQIFRVFGNPSVLRSSQSTLTHIDIFS